ncbi:aldehyde dehydrogenase family protein [Saccharomonospora sp. NB11]|uniref:aldehyde dehydrogenase family protein n=1 Tax=Saccharomonospora sp. NB11 TaxID=1642298 RepID=UPI0018D1A1E0|nr:aldehyde dehydrogenase family protein [Saccharomonospora sp. NB11]
MTATIPSPGRRDTWERHGGEGLTLAAMRVILDRWDDLLATLTEVATHSAAVDELRRSVATLAGGPWEIERRKPKRVSELAVFLPSNNILYSYVLFGLIPAGYADHVVIRPSARVRDVSIKLHDILRSELEPFGHFPIEIAPTSQRAFVRRCQEADVVVFTGQPTNAVSVSEQLPRQLMLCFGSGPNPVVIGPELSGLSVVDDIIRCRFYNSGQDCLAPDIVFVHESVADEVTRHLHKAVAELRLGPTHDPETDVAPLVYPDAVEGIHEFVREHGHAITAGGEVDPETGFVRPTVVELDWDPSFHPPEFFGPVLCLMRYRDAADITAWLNSPAERERGMYVSVYGEPGITGDVVGTSVVLREQATLDAENGNEPLGGFGFEGGHVRHGGTVTARPLLLSAELAAYEPTTPRSR